MVSIGLQSTYIQPQVFKSGLRVISASDIIKIIVVLKSNSICSIVRTRLGVRKEGTREYCAAD